MTLSAILSGLSRPSSALCLSSAKPGRRARLCAAVSAAAAATAAASPAFADEQVITEALHLDERGSLTASSVVVRGGSGHLQMDVWAVLGAQTLTIEQGGRADLGAVVADNEGHSVQLKSLALSAGSLTLTASASGDYVDIAVVDADRLAASGSDNSIVLDGGSFEQGGPAAVLAVQEIDAAEGSSLAIRAVNGAAFAYGMNSAQAQTMPNLGGSSSWTGREGAFFVGKDFTLTSGMHIVLGETAAPGSAEAAANLVVGENGRLILVNADASAETNKSGSAAPTFTAGEGTSVVFKAGSQIWVPDLTEASLDFLKLDAADVQGFDLVAVIGGNGFVKEPGEDIKANSYEGEFASMLTALWAERDSALMPKLFADMLNNRSGFDSKSAATAVSEMARVSTALGTDRRLSILYAETASQVADAWKSGDFADWPLSALRRRGADAEEGAGSREAEARSRTTPTLPIFISASTRSVEDESDLGGLGAYRMDVDESVFRAGTAVGMGAWRFGANVVWSSADAGPQGSGVRPFQGESEAMLFSVWGGRSIAGGRAGVVAVDLAYLSADERAELPIAGDWVESRGVKREAAAGGVSWLLPAAHGWGADFEGRLGARVIHFFKTDYSISDGAVDLMRVKEAAKTLGLVSAALTVRWSVALPAPESKDGAAFWAPLMPKRASLEAQAGADVFFGGSTRRAQYRACGVAAPAVSIDHEVFDETLLRASLGGVLDFSESRLGMEVFTAKTNGGYRADGAALRLDWVLG